MGGCYPKIRMKSSSLSQVPSVAQKGPLEEDGSQGVGLFPPQMGLGPLFAESGRRGSQQLVDLCPLPLEKNRVYFQPVPKKYILGKGSRNTICSSGLVAELLTVGNASVPYLLISCRMYTPSAIAAGSGENVSPPETTLTLRHGRQTLSRSQPNTAIVCPRTGEETS